MSVFCQRCILSPKDDPWNTLDEHGLCKVCILYDERIAAFKRTYPNPEMALMERVLKMKKDGKGKPYDCIIGLSGGTDSSYVALLTKELGLRALAVHLDNGWNSELAIMNIQRILDTLNMDLYTYVIDWEEFRDLQRAYIRASVIDIEALTDHAITAILYKVARKFNIPYILSGEHLATEGILPPSWVHLKLDHLNILDIHKRFGEKQIRTFPIMNYFKYVAIQRFMPLRFIPILNFVDYQKTSIKLKLEKELGWKDYGGKHHESIFTRFYQAYILPVKFGVDKRRSHLATLISAGQMTRETALEVLSKPPMDEDLIAADKIYVMRKLGFETDEFDFFMNTPPVPHIQYDSVIHRIRKIKRFLGK
jgi:N-acetyl sugar amidotransferase